MRATESKVEQLKEIYTRYEQAYARAQADAPACGGLLGMGESPKNAACHEVFYEAVEQWAAEFAQGNPGPEAAEEAAELILTAAHRYRDTGLYWYCYAAQGHAAQLVEFLTPQAAARLQSWYDSAYPVLDRMPVQKKLYKQLKKQAKQRQKT